MPRNLAEKPSALLTQPLANGDDALTAICTFVVMLARDGCVKFG
jgi:hypothetical protein